MIRFPVLPILFRSIALVVVSLSPTTAWTQEADVAERTQEGDVSKQFASVAEYTNHLVESGEVPGVVVLVAHEGKISLQHAAGLAKRDPERPMDTNTIFRIASMTKPVTSVGIMMLVEEGKIELSDPVSKYLPEFSSPSIYQPNGNRPANNEMTIHHLLTHTSGLAYDDAPGLGDLYRRAGIESGANRTALNLEENLARLSKLPLLFEPGKRFCYGMSTDVLGRVIEVVSEMPLDKFIHTRICAPLGMRDTYFIVPAEKRYRLSATFVHEDNKLRELGDCERILNGMLPVRMSPDHATDETHQYLSGGGGLCSTAEDYFRFCQMLVNRGKFNGKVLLKPETVEYMTVNRIGDIEAGVGGKAEWKFGYGFAVYPDTGGRKREIGWGGIWGTTFFISMDDNWVAILLTQRVFDESALAREVELTRRVREAIEQN